MSTDNLPLWYPLQEIGAVDFTISTQDEINQLIKERLELLKTLEGQKLQQDTLETDEEYAERMYSERKAFTLIKMGVALDPKLSAWFVEVEGDLFQNRFMKTDWSEKQILLDKLFPPMDGKSMWYTLEGLNEHLNDNVEKKLAIADKLIRDRIYFKKKGISRKSGNNNIIGVDFRYASFVVKNRRAKLYRGWVIDTVEKLTTTIKKRFEKALDAELSDYGERIETTAPGHIKRLASNLNETLRGLVKTRKEYSFDNITLEGELDENFNLFPPCIRNLLNTVNEVGYIPHWERFQLGLFLKKTGMPVEDQLQFWYNKAVDNINISYDQFVKKAGYIIRHIYGLEGARIDYDMPSCNTIQTKMYCTFRHQGIESINEQLAEYMKTLDGNTQAIKLPVAQKIMEFSSNGFANQACAAHFQLVNNHQIEKIIHPLQYLQIASNLQKPKEDREDEQEA